MRAGADGEARDQAKGRWRSQLMTPIYPYIRHPAGHREINALRDVGYLGQNADHERVQVAIVAAAKEAEAGRGAFSQDSDVQTAFASRRELSPLCATDREQLAPRDTIAAQNQKTVLHRPAIPLRL